MRLWRIIVFFIGMLVALHEIAWTGPSLKSPKALPSISISKPEFIGIVTDKGQGYTVPQFRARTKKAIRQTNLEDWLPQQ